MMSRPFPCECCAHESWRVIGCRIYERAHAKGASEYLRRRYRVLFESWFPDQISVKLDFICCTNCGQVIYTPRPTPVDIDDKYRLLTEGGPDDWGCGPIATIQRARSHALFDYLASHLDLGRVSRILDFGGGDGCLMQAFLEAGKRCFLVDYGDHPIPGVQRMGATLDAIPSSDMFDLIVCSHVIEHVAEPRLLLTKLSRHLAARGCLYVEVPMEIWKRPPIQMEPVTHINFFTPNSLWNLLVLSGLAPQHTQLKGLLGTGGRAMPAVRSLSVRIDDAGATSDFQLRPVDVDRFLKPGPVDKLRYHAANPAGTWRAIGYACGLRGKRQPAPRD